MAGVAVDVADSAAGWLAGEDGTVDRTTSYLLTAPAVAAALAGLAGVRRRLTPIGPDHRREGSLASHGGTSHALPWRCSTSVLLEER